MTEPTVHNRSTYINHGCRCDSCRAACAEYQRRFRAARRPEDAKEHGTASTYNNYGCRCEPCRLAHSKECAQQRVKRRAVRVAEPWLALPIPAGIPATVTAAAQEAARQVIGCWTLTSTLPGPSLPPVMHEVYEAARAVERAAGWDFSALQNPELVRENLLGRAADLLAGVLGIDVLVEERLAVVDARAELDAEFDQHADTLGGAA